MFCTRVYNLSGVTRTPLPLLRGFKWMIQQKCLSAYEDDAVQLVSCEPCTSVNEHCRSQNSELMYFHIRFRKWKTGKALFHILHTSYKMSFSFITTKCRCMHWSGGQHNVRPNFASSYFHFRSPLG
jgi:hypothetical protein